MKAFVVRPRFDPATEVTFGWSRRVLPLLQNAGLEVVNLGGDRANRRRVERELNADLGNKGLFLFYDHGSDDCFFQKPRWRKGRQVPKSIIDTGNVGLLRNKIVFSVCCLAGKTLREICIHQKGGLAFLGYREVFGFFRHVSDYFGECANSGVEALLEGQDVHEAAETMRNKFLEYERYFLTGPGRRGYSPWSSEIAEALRHNKENLVVLSKNQDAVRL